VRPRIILMIGLISLFGLPQALGQSNRDTSKQSRILLDSTEVSIGMPRDVAISRLAQSYKLDKQENSDSWIVMAKQNEGNQTTYRAVGSVSFKDGKLNAVYKKWGPQDGHTDVDFARGIYGVIASLASRGKTDCRIRIGEDQQPTGEIRSAFIMCGDEYIQVDIIRSAEHGEFSDLTEVLKARVK
jgi:hypothetical protein